MYIYIYIYTHTCRCMCIEREILCIMTITSIMINDGNDTLHT